MAYKDWPAEPRSDQDIEHLALACRIQAASEREWMPDIFDLVERLKKSGRLSGLQVIVRHDDDLVGDDARAFVEQRVIEVKKSVYDGARKGVPRDRMTIAHEIGHVVLDHRGEPKSRKPGAVGREKGISPFRSAERQATVFAARFLMLGDQVKQCKSPAEVVARFNVSSEAARIRFEQVNDREAAKLIPPDLKAAIRKASKPAEKDPLSRWQSSTLAPEQQVRLAWETANELVGHDPKEFRCVDGLYAIRWSRRNMEAPGGWRLKSGKIIPWDAEQP